MELETVANMQYASILPFGRTEHIADPLAASNKDRNNNWIKMNFEFTEKINPFLEKLDFQSAIKIAEDELVKIPETEFHFVLDKSLLDQSENLMNWINEFYEKMKIKLNVKAFYFEMIEFDINTKVWDITGFVFDKDEGLEDIEWFCDVTRDVMTENEFVILGYENLQLAFQKFVELIDKEEPISDNLQNSRDWCEQIVIARFMEIMRNAHNLAKKNNLKWSEIPIYFTEHSYDFIVKSE